MSKNEYLRILLISVIFSLSVLVILPKVVLNYDSYLLTVNSDIGGYEIKFPGKEGEKTFSLKEFKTGLDIGGGSRLIFRLENFDYGIKERFESITRKRLGLIGVLDYEISWSDEDPGTMNLDVPSHVSVDRVSALVLGNGLLNIKKLKNSEEWNPNNFDEYILNQDLWEITNVSEKDIVSINAYVNTSGYNSIQINFNNEGNEKFRNLAKENIDKPVAIYINDQSSPFSIAVLPKEVAFDLGKTVSFSGGFTKQIADDYVIQRNTPFLENISYVGSNTFESKIGNDFVLKYGASFLIGLTLSFIFFIFKFGKFGIYHGVSVLLSLVLISAIVKIFSITVGAPEIIGIVVLVLILSDFGYSLLGRLKSELSQGKPFDLVSYQVFEKDKSFFNTPLLLIFIITMFLYPFNIGSAKTLSLFIAVSMFVAMFFYPFLVRTFSEVFREKIK